MVKKHHGDIRVESQPGDTRFQVRLPFSVRPGNELVADQGAQSAEI